MDTVKTCNKCKISKQINENYEQLKSGSFRATCRTCRTSAIRIKQAQKNETATITEQRKCVNCNLKVPANKFHGKICNSCHWKKKTNKNKEKVKETKLTELEYALQNKRFPEKCTVCEKAFNETDFKLDTQKMSFNGVCRECTNARNYTADFRERQRESNLPEFLAKNNAVHREWKAKKSRRSCWFPLAFVDL